MQNLRAAHWRQKKDCLQEELKESVVKSAGTISCVPAGSTERAPATDSKKKRTPLTYLIDSKSITGGRDNTGLPAARMTLKLSDFAKQWLASEEPVIRSTTRVVTICQEILTVFVPSQ